MSAKRVLVTDSLHEVGIETLRREGLESRTPVSEDFASLLDAELRTDRGVWRVAGTLFHRREPRIVRINDLALEAVPSGWMLVSSNVDVPGVIGRIGTLFERHGINIAGIQLGRERPGGRAVSVLNLDDPRRRARGAPRPPRHPLRQAHKTLRNSEEGPEPPFRRPTGHPPGSRRPLAPHAPRRTRLGLAGRGPSWSCPAREPASPPGSLMAGTRAVPLKRSARDRRLPRGDRSPFSAGSPHGRPKNPARTDHQTDSSASRR